MFALAVQFLVLPLGGFSVGGGGWESSCFKVRHLVISCSSFFFVCFTHKRSFYIYAASMLSFLGVSATFD